MSDHNVALKLFRAGRPADADGKGGAGSVETYDRPVNIEWQTRDAPPTDYENALGDALEAIFNDEVYELPDIVSRLNDAGVRAADGKAWTEESFKAEMKRLGV